MANAAEAEGVMDYHDLLVRGFWRSHLSKFDGFCGPCGDYRTFSWWQSPNRDGGFELVTVCESCHCVPTSDARLVRRHQPMRQAVAS